MPDQAKINFYPFSDGAALHKVGSHRLWVLNHSSAVLWCLFEEYGESDFLIQAYADHFQIPNEQARTDVTSALKGFAETGLFSQEARGAWRVAGTLGTRDEGRGTRKAKPLKANLKLSLSWQKHYEVAGVSWQINCQDEDAAERFFNCLAHLEAGESVVDLQYTVVQEGKGWTVSNATEESALLAENEVLPALLTMLFGDLCASLSKYLLLHSAVAYKDASLVMFPGESAFGKSTLSAALAASGWSLFSDELAPLDTATLKVAPFVMPVGIKSRSLSVLQNYFPDIERYPAWQRADGQVLRYIAPSQVALADSSEALKPVSAIIFPRFIPNAETSIEQLTPLKALELLGNTGSSERALEPDDVKALLALAEGRPCWSLVYSDLGEAVEAVGRVTSG